MGTNPLFLSAIADYYKPKGSKINISWMNSEERQHYFEGIAYAKAQELKS